MKNGRRRPRKGVKLNSITGKGKRRDPIAWLTCKCTPWGSVNPNCQVHQQETDYIEPTQEEIANYLANGDPCMAIILNAKGLLRLMVRV